MKKVERVALLGEEAKDSVEGLAHFTQEAGLAARNL